MVNHIKLLKISKLFLFFVILNGLFSCSVQQDLEYERDIRPIVETRCLSCHVEQGIAPITLSSYDQIRKYRKNIILQVDSGRMPPWPADPDYSQFVGQLCLRSGERDTLLNWLNGELNRGTLIHEKEEEKRKVSLYPGPDTVISFGKALKLEGNGLDHFYLVSIPFDFEQDTIIQSIAFFPGNHSLVHHVNGHLVQFDTIDSNVPRGTIFLPNDSLDPEAAFSLLGLKNADGSFPTLTQSAFNYLPGVLPVKYPSGIGGFRVKKHVSFLCRDIHYGPSSRDTTDQSRIGIYYAKEKPKRITGEIQMGTLGITDIEPPLVVPPNTMKKFSTRYTVSSDLSILTVNPHMHRLGWSFLAYAHGPDGDTIQLIRIPRWDFNWQYFYTFVNPVHIPKGYTIVAEGVFNNTIANPFIPFHPPREVSERAGSMRTSDEMFQFIITAMKYEKGDEKIKLEPDVPRGTIEKK